MDGRGNEIVKINKIKIIIKEEYIMDNYFIIHGLLNDPCMIK